LTEFGAPRRCEHLALDLHTSPLLLLAKALLSGSNTDFRHRAGAETALIVAEEPTGDTGPEACCRNSGFNPQGGSVVAGSLPRAA